MYDYQVVCFNGANRTRDRETTDTTAVHSISKKCEEFIIDFCKTNDIVCISGVAIGTGLLTKLIDALVDNNFIENWTFFCDDYNPQKYQLDQL